MSVFLFNLQHIANDSLCLKPRCGIRSMGEPLSFIKECRFATNAFSSICTRLGLTSSSHLESSISMTVGEAYSTPKKKKELEAKKWLFLSSESSDASFCTDVEPVLQLKGLSQMSKDDTDWNLMGCKCWNETSKSAGKVLPLLSIDNRYTSCLRRKQQTCGVFGLELSVTGIVNLTL